VGSDKRSTQEIDVEGLGDSLSPAREKKSPDQETIPLRRHPFDGPRATAPITALAVTAPMPALDARDATATGQENDHVDLADVEEIEDVEDVEDDAIDVVLLPAEELLSAEELLPAEESSPSLVGTVPGHDIVQALRAMMDDVEDAGSTRARFPVPVEDGDTQTRPATTDPPLDKTGEDDALPAFPLDEPSEETPRAFVEETDLANRAQPAGRSAGTTITQAVTSAGRTTQTTAAASAPVRSMPRAAPQEPKTDEVEVVDVPPPPKRARATVNEAVTVVRRTTPDLGELMASAPSLDAPRADATRPALVNDNLDQEETELFEARRFGPLIALYRQRLASTDEPAKKAALLLRIARVYEAELDDANEAFKTLVEAFELVPDNSEVADEIDRLGKATQRLGELADWVRKKLLPGAPDQKRVAYLGHLVFWYERVLRRSSEVSPFVSELERHDKSHPAVLKRAAQLAAMNGNTRAQRELLTQALDRTSRKEERVALHLALASAYATTADALKHYEIALQADPTSVVALQGVKRIGREKERYDQVRWALERQIELVATDAERIEALLELAELLESKFLKREAAADLLERVLTIEPSHPAALKGLERCYHALRDWPKLARILSVRAEQALDKRTKVELLERAAEVHESKLGDPPGAVEVYRNLLMIDPKHRRALGDLARLYEKLADWTNVATYRARLADLAPTKRLTSQELVKLGDFLIDRDRIAARLQYERAVVIDPTNAAGWEAIQKVSAEAGDDRRVIECLEQRTKHTDVPRQRAVVLVELARIHQAQGNEDAARKAFEAAVRADSANELAAIAMLDIYAAEGRWAEAAPLCELLVNAAIRDRDGEALFVRLRLATRIAAALGDADRAVTSAVAALDARPKDVGARADLIAVASQCLGSAPAALSKARAYLGRIAEDPDALAVDNLVQLAALQRDGGDLDGAAGMLERARALQSEDMTITKELADVYLAQGDFPRACKLKVDMARNATSAEARFDLLCEAGDIWARRADELETAASVFEEARALKPLDPWLLQTLTWLYGELEEWAMLASVLEDTAQASQDSPAERAKTLIAMAEVVRDKLDDRARAANLYDLVLDIDKKRLDVFEGLVRMLTEDKDWGQLERSYRKMLARVKDDDASQLEFLLLYQLGLIYRDRLGDAAHAYDVLDAASRLRPDDPGLRKIVIELLVVTDNLDNAVARVREEIDRDPHEPQLYAELYELFLRQHSFDKAWCAINVLAQLGEPTPEQRRFHEDYAPMPLDGVPGQIVEQAWSSHLIHGDLDPALTGIFALVTPVVARMRWDQLRPEQRVGRPFTPKHSRMHDIIRTTFDNAAEILSIAAPELLFGDPNGVTPFAPALAPFGAVLVSGPAIEAQADSLVYLVGKRLAEQRPELAARTFFPSVAELTSILNMAMRLSRNEVARDPAGAALDQSFAAVLEPEEAASLRSIVLEVTAANVTLDVKAWSRAADLSSTRAGLLIAGDVGPTRIALLAEGAHAGQAGELAARDKVGALYKFATSDLYSELRVAIGVAVQA
jgi:tetratricopeptide (TPR) repeat protein